MGKKYIIKASKHGRTVEQKADSPEQKSRWESLFIQNGWRVIRGKGL